MEAGKVQINTVQRVRGAKERGVINCYQLLPWQQQQHCGGWVIGYGLQGWTSYYILFFPHFLIFLNLPPPLFTLTGALGRVVLFLSKTAPPAALSWPATAQLRHLHTPKKKKKTLGWHRKTAAGPEAGFFFATPSYFFNLLCSPLSVLAPFSYLKHLRPVRGPAVRAGKKRRRGERGDFFCVCVCRRVRERDRQIVRENVLTDE